MSCAYTFNTEVAAPAPAPKPDPKIQACVNQYCTRDYSGAPERCAAAVEEACILPSGMCDKGVKPECAYLCQVLDQIKTSCGKA